MGSCFSVRFCNCFYYAGNYFVVFYKTKHSTFNTSYSSFGIIEQLLPWYEVHIRLSTLRNKSQDVDLIYSSMIWPSPHDLFTFKFLIALVIFSRVIYECIPSLTWFITSRSKSGTLCGYMSLCGALRFL